MDMDRVEQKIEFWSRILGDKTIGGKLKKRTEGPEGIPKTVFNRVRIPPTPPPIICPGRKNKIRAIAQKKFPTRMDRYLERTTFLLYSLQCTDSSLFIPF